MCCRKQAGSDTSTGTLESAMPLHAKLSCAVQSPTICHHLARYSNLVQLAPACEFPVNSRCTRVPHQVACMQGHVRIGPETVTEPAFLVTRSMEDFVTWVDTSKIKRKISAYNEQLDDFLIA